MSKHITSAESMEEFVQLLEDAPQRGPGAVVQAISAFLADEEIAELVAVAPATVRGWRSDRDKRVKLDAADKLDAVRVIAISRIRRSTTAWTLPGLGAWFRARNFSLLEEGRVPITPLDALRRWPERKVMLALMGESGDTATD